MSYAHDPLADPRRAESEEHALHAEEAWSRGDRAEARRSFAAAANLEEAVAREVEEATPRLRSLLAISAAALWYKAEDYPRSKSVAYYFLGREGLTEQGRTKLEELVERCSRESELGRDAHDASLIPVEVKLDGGRVRVGLAPANAARKRSASVTQLLTRSAELLSKIPYRDRGESDVDRHDQINIYEAPARAASYGLRFYVATGAQQTTPTERGVTPEMVVETFLMLAACAEQGPDAIREAVRDEQYAHAIIGLFMEIAPDGEDVGEVLCSAPSWKVPGFPQSKFGPHHRDALRAGLGPAFRDARKGERIVDGRLAKVLLAYGEKWIEIEVAPGEPHERFMVESRKVQAKAARLHEKLVRAFVAYSTKAKRPVVTDVQRAR